MDQKRLARIILGVILLLSVSVVLGVAGYLMKNRPIKIIEAPVAVESNELTVKSLKDAEYDTEIGNIRFKDGEYRDDPFYAEILSDKVAFGNLSSDDSKDAAVVYYYTGGGSGSFYFLNAIINQNGNPRYVARIDLGDRVVVNSVEIKNGRIIIDMVVQGPDDGLCCPTARKVFEYELQENKLVKISESNYDEIAATDISTWKTYSDEKYGFEMKYPSDWTIIEYQDDNCSIVIDGDQKNCVYFERNNQKTEDMRIIIGVSNFSAKENSDYSLKGIPEGIRPEAKEILMAGVRGYEVDISDELGEVQQAGKNLFLEKDESLSLTIDYMYSIDEGSFCADKGNDCRNIIENILSAFKFIK